jgi:hypothetical protein
VIAGSEPSLLHSPETDVLVAASSQIRTPTNHADRQSLLLADLEGTVAPKQLLITLLTIGLSV